MDSDSCSHLLLVPISFLLQRKDFLILSNGSLLLVELRAESAKVTLDISQMRTVRTEELLLLFLENTRHLVSHFAHGMLELGIIFVHEGDAAGS